MENKQKCGCSCGSNCCGAEQKVNEKIVIDFLYLDLSICTRCKGTEKALDDAITDVSQLLKAAGRDVIVNKINITSRELAIEHKFESSPTIRVNGRDIDSNIKESKCESCRDLCGKDVDCRVWVYQGVEYTEPPKAMIVNALLHEVYVKQSPAVTEKNYVLPENLKIYFKAIQNKLI